MNGFKVLISRQNRKIFLGYVGGSWVIQWSLKVDKGIISQRKRFEMEARSERRDMKRIQLAVPGFEGGGRGPLAKECR